MNTYKIIDLSDEIAYKGISKYKRYQVEALSPIDAVKLLFPNFTPKLDREGMGNVLVFGEIKMKGELLQVNHTYNLIPV